MSLCVICVYVLRWTTVAESSDNHSSITATPQRKKLKRLASGNDKIQNREVFYR